MILTPLAEVKQNLFITLRSFGVKSGEPFPPAELYLDCRGLANPIYGGPSGTGDDPKVQGWVANFSDITLYFRLVEEAFSRLTTRKGKGKEYDAPFRIVCMCAHGIHRSRSLKHILAGWLRMEGYQRVEVQ